MDNTPASRFSPRIKRALVYGAWIWLLLSSMYVPLLNHLSEVSGRELIFHSATYHALYLLAFLIASAVILIFSDSRKGFPAVCAYLLPAAAIYHVLAFVPHNFDYGSQPLFLLELTLSMVLFARCTEGTFKKVFLIGVCFVLEAVLFGIILFFLRLYPSDLLFYILCAIFAAVIALCIYFAKGSRFKTIVGTFYIILLTFAALAMLMYSEDPGDSDLPDSTYAYAYSSAAWSPDHSRNARLVARYSNEQHFYLKIAEDIIYLPFARLQKIRYLDIDDRLKEHSVVIYDNVHMEWHEGDLFEISQWTVPIDVNP